MAYATPLKYKTVFTTTSSTRQDAQMSMEMGEIKDGGIISVFQIEIPDPAV